VRRSISASVALFSALAVPAFLVSSSRGQINGPPASVSSPGFGGHAINGARASVTSLGPNGYAPSPRFSTSGIPFDGRDGRDGRQRHHHFVPYAPPVFYAVPLPYAVDVGATEDDAGPNADDRDANYQGGPTVFDRRGSGPDSYIPPVRNAPAPRSADRTDDATAAAPDPLEPTMLIFKDGHKLEVGNYAIIGQTLFDMTPGHARKVPLADLDLEATRRQNDERGITFQLPISSRAN
jgi:hypothetical protein